MISRSFLLEKLHQTEAWQRPLRFKNDWELDLVTMVAQSVPGQQTGNQLLMMKDLLR